MAIVTLTKQQRAEVSANRYLKIALAKRSFFHFLSHYLRHRFELHPALFHKDMIDALDSVDDINKYLAIMGFRGSAKSTILEAFALWSLINGMHNFIIWVGNTETDAKMALANIRAEIEENDELRRDFGIILDDSEKGHGFREKWSETQITIGNCTILARSRGQKVRGMKFKKARIDLIIGDDLEDVEGAATTEKRAKTRTWFFTEVLPATKQGVQADHVKVVLLGNYVHKDCLLARLSKGKVVRFLKFALIDEDGNITWPALYPDMDAVEKEKEKVMLAGEGEGIVIWMREYLLKDVDTADMVLTLSDFQRYPADWLQRQAAASGTGVDLAISKKQTADYTAMVHGQDIKDDEGKMRLCLSKDFVEKRLGFEETIQKAVEINEFMPKGHKWYVENVAYQAAAIEIMSKNGLNVTGIASVKDKRSRFISAAFYIKNGRVLLPEEGAEKLIEKLLGFGIDDHDDVCDAFVDLVLGMVKRSGGILLG